MPRRHLLLLGALLIAIVSAVRPARADDISATARGVVRVVTLAVDGDQGGELVHGTGFAIAPDRIVTNAHVVELAARDPEHVVIGIVPSAGEQSFRGRVIAYDPARDLAEIAFDGARLPPVSLYNGPLSDGAQVVALGYPGNVDLATAQSALDYITPLSPVRSQGVFSGARSLQGVRVLLHTAGIARGNSGGPLLDPCGRVVGVNSAITGGQDGDSSFAFAISDSELAQFLREAGQTYQSTGAPCTSIENRLAADAEAAQQEHAAAEAAKRERADAEAMKRQQALADARAREERIAENFMALAAVLLVAGALALGGAGFLVTRGEGRHASWAGVAAGAFFVAAIAVFLSRPDGEVSLATAGLTGPSGADGRTPTAPSGRLLCRFVPERSRVTVSSTQDITIDWRASGCVNGRTQYLPSGDTWQHVLVPDVEDTVSALGFDPATRTYTATRYLLDSTAMARAREARGNEPGACATNEPAREALASHQAAIRATLPDLPNEKLVYHCMPGGERR